MLTARPCLGLQSMPFKEYQAGMGGMLEIQPAPCTQKVSRGTQLIDGAL